MKDNVARADKFAHQGRVSNVALHEFDVWPPEAEARLARLPREKLSMTSMLRSFP